MRKRFFTTLLISIVCICSAHAACEDKEGCRCKGYALTELGCNPCQKGYYKNTEDDSECTKCDNGPTDTNAKYTEEGWTTPNCPWTLTCSDNTLCYNEDDKKCQSEENTYVSGDGTVNFDGTKLTNNAKCKKCPAGSKIQIDRETSKVPQITDCYMKIGYTKFCDKDGNNCIDFNNVFPSGSEIRYTE